VSSPSSVRRFLLLAALALVGCGGSATGTPCPTDSTLTAENFGNDFMSRYCTRCHASSLKGSARQGAPSDANFDTLAAVRKDAEEIDRWSGAGPNAENTSMPPNAPAPTTAERQKLSEWLACGAP
jgi:uncharacterized membrane protein